MQELHQATPDATYTLEHELGHCLGFAHRHVGIMSQEIRWVPSDDLMIDRGGY